MGAPGAAAVPRVILQNLWSIRLAHRVSVEEHGAMSQSNFGFDPIHKRTRKEIFLEEMNRVG